MNIKAIILARGGSKGIPNKNIMDFCGKPLIQWTIENCLQSKYLESKDVWVSSDSDKILDISKQLGVCTWRRPDDISTDISTSEEAICNLLNEFKSPYYDKIDYVVFPQVTSPLRTSEDIDKSIETIINTGADSLFSACKLDDYCIWNNKNKSITYDYKDRLTRQIDRNLCYLENGSIYVFNPNTCFVNRLYGDIVKYIMPFWKSYELDTPDDIEICEYYMKRKIINV